MSASATAWSNPQYLVDLGISMNDTTYTMNDSVATMNDQQANPLLAQPTAWVES